MNRLFRLFFRSLNFFMFFFLISNSSMLFPLQLIAAEPSEEATVLLAILARNKAHVLPRYLKCIDKLDYDKSLITVYINTNNNTDETEEILEEWVQEHEKEYRKIIFDAYDLEDAEETMPHEWTVGRFKILAKIRNDSMNQAKEHGCDYYFVVDCDNFIAPYTLKELIKKDKPIIAPLLRALPDPNNPYSNYFCDIDQNGYYKNHPNYIKILRRSMTGTFKVPVVHCTYLINANVLDQLNYDDGTDDYEFVIFSRVARNNQIDQYICNEKHFGYLLHFYQTLSLEEETNAFNRIPIEKFLL